MELKKKILKAVEKIKKSKASMHTFGLSCIEHGFGWYGLTLPIIEEIRRYNKRNPKDKIYINKIKVLQEFR